MLLSQECVWFRCYWIISLLFALGAFWPCVSFGLVVFTLDLLIDLLSCSCLIWFSPYAMTYCLIYIFGGCVCGVWISLFLIGYCGYSLICSHQSWIKVRSPLYFFFCVWWIICMVSVVRFNLGQIFCVAFHKVSTVTNANSYFHTTFHVCVDRPTPASKLRQIFCLLGKHAGFADSDDKLVSERKLCCVWNPWCYLLQFNGCS